MIDPTAFQYLKPTDEQLELMVEVRNAFTELADILSELLPEGPDRTYVMRKLRECAMWSNVAITRNADGSPRT